MRSAACCRRRSGSLSGAVDGWLRGRGPPADRVLGLHGYFVDVIRKKGARPVIESDKEGNPRFTRIGTGERPPFPELKSETSVEVPFRLMYGLAGSPRTLDILVKWKDDAGPHKSYETLDVIRGEG
jgi:hypothetical protein